MKPKNYKYKFYVGSNYVKCEGSYAGRKVYAVAKCHPDDDFDLEKGKKLAELRCAAKIAYKRMRCAENKRKTAAKVASEAATHYVKMLNYEESANIEYKEIIEDLSILEKNI